MQGDDGHTPPWDLHKNQISAWTKSSGQAASHVDIQQTEGNNWNKGELK